MTTAQRTTIAHIEAAHEAQRFSADQAIIETAALSGQLGIETQLVAMSQAYMDLRSQGRFEEARVMKLRAIAFKAAHEARS